jgi:uncharacterized membrane protein YjdF
MAAIRELILAAFLLVIAIMLTVFACTLITDHNAYPLIPLVFYAFIPVPAWLCITKSSTTGFGSNGGTPMDNMGHFLLGLFAAAGPCMTLVLYHTDKMTLSAMLLCFGTAIFAAASALVLKRSMRERDSDMFT